MGIAKTLRALVANTRAAEAAVPAAWAAVAAFDEVAPWPRVEGWEEVRGALLTAYHEAETAKEAAEAALADAVLSAPHGANGNTFITDRTLIMGSRGRVRTLSIQGRPAARINYWLGTAEPSSIKILTPEEGEAAYREAQRLGRAAANGYAASLAEAAEVVLEANLQIPTGLYPWDNGASDGEALGFLTLGWEWYRGQEGGCVRAPNGVWISVPGLHRRVAKLRRERDARRAERAARANRPLTATIAECLAARRNA